MTENITYPRVVIIVSHNGVFTQSDTDSYTNTDTDRIGLYWHAKNSDTHSCTDSDVDGYCNQFGTYIGTDKVEFNPIS